MRQAGRFLPEYRAIRERIGFLELCRTPEVAAEVTVLPVEKLGVDAAILFADILLLLEPLGVGLEFSRGEGPVIRRPVRSPADVERLVERDPAETVPFVFETVRRARTALGDRVPLIGFAGAPFTVASYLVEGRPSRTYANTKALMHGDPDLWARLMERLADLAVTSLRSQIAEGASAVQVFDSWAGALAPKDYERFVLPWSRRVFEGVADLGVPRIHFGVGTGELLSLMAAAGPDVVGVDWRVPLDEARRRVGRGKAVQGNLDPALCLAPWDVVAEAAREVLAANAGRPGHVFNLGHGVLPETDPDVLTRIVARVHELTA